MIGLDTNILVRYLTHDDEHQWQQAATIIQQTQPCFVTNIVLCGRGRRKANDAEFEFVYSVSKSREVQT